MSQKQNLRTVAQMMADFTFGLTYDSIPADVMVAARRHLADTLACALGARNTTAACALEKYAIEKSGRADATILGTNEKPAGLAALVNGTMVRYLDADDIFVLSRGGPSLAKMEWLLEGVAPALTAKRLLELCARLSTADDIDKLIETCRVRSK
jgi:hypothetical protein